MDLKLSACMRLAAVGVVLAGLAGTAGAAGATFEEFSLAPESHYGGADSGAGDFTSGGWVFPHNATAWSWDGFLYSNETDTITAGYLNQYAAITGGGVDGSANYGIGYVPLDWMSDTYEPIAQTINPAGQPCTVAGMYVTNTTYAYLAMANGDGPSRRFGYLDANGDGDFDDQGDFDGTYPDYLKLIITGTDAGGNATAPIEFYLADFRAADSADDYILNEWTYVDLSGLGEVTALQFSFAGSDVGDFGINTPTYFALDNVVPEPTSLAMLAVGAAAMIRRRRPGRA